MIKLEQLKRKMRVKGIVPGQTVELIEVERSGPNSVSVSYRQADGTLDGRASKRATSVGRMCWRRARIRRLRAWRWPVWSKRGGKVRLINWREYYDPGAYDPAQDTRLTVWEAAHHLIERLNHHGEMGAAALYAKLPADMPDAARDLAYRLYHVCDRKSWAEDALDYNALVSSWSEISHLAGSREESGTQDEMFGD